MKKEIKEMEKRDAAGYARQPSQPGEVEEWQTEQVWPDGDDQQHCGIAELAAEDRDRATEEPHSDRDLKLKDLLTGVTKKNRHPEVGFGHPIGIEKL